VPHTLRKKKHTQRPVQSSKQQRHKIVRCLQNKEQKDHPQSKSYKNSRKTKLTEKIKNNFIKKNGKGGKPLRDKSKNKIVLLEARRLEIRLPKLTNIKNNLKE